MLMMDSRIYICLYIGLVLTFGSADEYLFRKSKTRLGSVDLSLVLWSGLADSLRWCTTLCAGEPKCVSLLYNNTEKSCKIFNLLHTLDNSTEETDLKYYTIERASNQKLPESCADLANCSGTNTDGEYWLYPKATSGQRVKVYCHDMGTNPKEYITLKYTNTFVQHDKSNWIIQREQCQTNYKNPLKQGSFSKIAINIQDMTVNASDYTFAVRTGDFNIVFGEATDCNGGSLQSNCPRFGNAVINTLGSGMILDRNTEWGVLISHNGGILNFMHSEDGAEISYSCAGWCGYCGPLTNPLRLVLSSEIEKILNHTEKMSDFIKRLIRLWVYIGFISCNTGIDEIVFRKVKTRLEWMEGSVALWSGVARSRGHCSSLCGRKLNCVSLVYVNKDKFCKLLSILYKLDETVEESETEYYIIDRANNRRLPESCADFADCSGTSTDGEYWLYPKATNGQRVKVYCHNMGTNPKEYITLKHNNTFVQHDSSNWIFHWKQCQTGYKPPLKLAEFFRVAINIQDMTMNGADYTFAVCTENFKLVFGQARDCNGDSSTSKCPHYGDAMINTLGSGMILDRNIEWGLLGAHKAEMQKFRRSEDGAEISFTCAGWCGLCGPLAIKIYTVI